MSVFVDATAFIALVVATDSHHKVVSAHWAALLQARERLVTTSYVVHETVAVLQKRFGLDVAKRFVRDLLPITEVWWVDERLHAEGTLVWLNFNRQTLSLVDCVSFAAMTARMVPRALSCDRHFAEQGFEVLP